jgi:hypothetical protein
MAAKASQEPKSMDESESISLYLATGERETVQRATSISFDRGRVVCRDREGQALRTISASGLAFATLSPDPSGLNVWI